MPLIRNLSGCPDTPSRFLAESETAARMGSRGKEELSISARPGAMVDIQGHHLSVPIKACRVPSHIGSANERFIHRTMERFRWRAPHRYCTVDAPTRPCYTF